MIKKIVITLLPVFVLAVNLPAHSAGQIGFDFSASNPIDQLAWMQTDSTVQVAVVNAEKTKRVAQSDSSWDPLGVTASASSKASVVPVVAKKLHDDLLKQVSAKKRENAVLGVTR